MPESRCLCGDHVWRVDAPLQRLHHCHCTYCRKHQGTAYTTVGAVAPEHFSRLRRGDSVAYPSSPGLTRCSCARCGSPISGEPAGGLGLMFVFAGPLEGDPGAAPSAHGFAASKAPWFEIEDGLPAFDATPPGFDAPALETPTPVDPPEAGVRGSCLCGRVRFAIRGAPIVARHCHCLRCRRARGALHASNLVVPLGALRFSRGRDAVRSYKLPGARFFTQSFCPHCGCAAPVVDPGREIAIVPMGSLDDDPGVRPSEHIWVGSKASWHEIADALPQHLQGPPA